MISITTHSPAETHALGEALAKGLAPGDVVLLYGDLGAGKSALTRGIAAGLGIQGPLPSPSFPILLAHEGPKFPLYHLDLYRLEDVDAFYAIGLEEVLGGDGVAVVEWPERALSAMPARHLRIQIELGDGEEDRLFTLTPMGGMPESVLEAFA